jgi:hypothetical protein
MGINLQALIDEVLGMVKSRKSSSADAPTWYGGNKDEEDYWKDIRKRNTSLEVGKQEIAGQKDLELIKNTGSLARQTLANEGATGAANINAGAIKYSADQKLTGDKYSTDVIRDSINKGLPIELIKGHVAVLSNALSTPEQIKESNEALSMFTRNAMPNAGKIDVMPFDKPDTPAAPATTTPKPGIKPGAPSMEFRAGASPEEEALKKKKMEDRLLFGTKPQARSMFNF